MATKPADGQSESSTLSIFINDFTDSDNEASAEVWAWGLEQNPSVKGIYIAEPRWVNLGYYMTSNDFGSCIKLVDNLPSNMKGKDPPLTTVLAGRMTPDIIKEIDNSSIQLEKKERDLVSTTHLETGEDLGFCWALTFLIASAMYQARIWTEG